MPIRFFLVLVVMVCICGGCEQVVATDDLPFVNHLVIFGYITVGAPLDSISVSRTLPLSVRYDPAAAAVPDARVTVTVDGKTIPLAYSGNSYFGDTQKTIVQTGKTYQITVDWNGMHAEASTVAPHVPDLDSFALSDPRIDTTIYRYGSSYVDTTIYPSIQMGFQIRAHGTEVYEILSDSQLILSNGTASIRGGYDYYYDYRDLGIFPGTDAASNGDLLVKKRIFNRDTILQVYATIASFDKPYLEFKKTYSTYDNPDLFGVQGSNPKWNVTGDGIGIFIGRGLSSYSFTIQN